MDNDEILTPEEVSDMLGKDPFALEDDVTPVTEGGEPAPDESVVAPTGEEEPAAIAEPGTTAEPAPVDEVVPAAVVPESNPEMDLLRQQNALLQQRITGMESAQTPAAPVAEAPTAPSIPDYNFTMPVELQTLLNSEDPGERAQGMRHMMTGVARSVHQQIMGEVSQNLNSMQQSFGGVVQSTMTAQTERQAIFEDFYNNNTDLNNPALRPVIVNIAQQVMTEQNTTQWSEQIRNLVAQRARTVLGLAPPVKKTTVPTPPAIIAGSGGSDAARPVTAGVNSEQDIANTLF